MPKHCFKKIRAVSLGRLLYHSNMTNPRLTPRTKWCLSCALAWPLPEFTKNAKQTTPSFHIMTAIDMKIDFLFIYVLHNITFFGNRVVFSNVLGKQVKWKNYHMIANQYLLFPWSVLFSLFTNTHTPIWNCCSFKPIIAVEVKEQCQL